MTTVYKHDEITIDQYLTLLEGHFVSLRLTEKAEKQLLLEIAAALDPDIYFNEEAWAERLDEEINKDSIRVLDGGTVMEIRSTITKTGNPALIDIEDEDVEIVVD